MAVHMNLLRGKFFISLEQSFNLLALSITKVKKSKTKLLKSSMFKKYALIKFLKVILSSFRALFLEI